MGNAKVRVRKGAAASGNKKAIMDKDAMKRKGCISGTVYKLAMALVEENDDNWSSLSEDNGIREAQDGGQANDIGQNLIDHSNSLESDSDNSKKTGFNSGPDQTDGSYENSVSHVSKTLKTINQGEEALRRHSYGLRTNKPSKYGGKSVGSSKRHGMVTRFDRSKVQNIHRVLDMSGKSISTVIGSEEFEVEVANIIEKGVAIGVLKGSNVGMGSWGSLETVKCNKTVH
ncbi:hypothetical protein LWI28_006148 [Acer negundo]|uniref:Uncharacterized protein n=1 Tax=Acer negundo TaxID=4023 RepID=A0AAD5ICE0_ACENE|nr:hypothetical protein LWI28_006148 [Acer negundo]